MNSVVDIEEVWAEKDARRENGRKQVLKRSWKEKKSEISDWRKRVDIL